MATSMKPAPPLSYEQLLEMISAFQWMPEQKCFRLAQELDRDKAASNRVFGCLHHYAAAIERLGQNGPLSGHKIQLFLFELVQRYEVVQRIDGDSVVNEVNRLVQAIGVDLVLIGVGNTYATAFVLLVRSRAPLEWNKFCDFVEKQDWKVPLVQAGAQSHSEMDVAGAHVELEREAPSANNETTISTAAELPSSMVGGLARAFDNKEFAAYADSVLNDCRNSEQVEEDQDISACGPDICAGRETTNKSYGWSFKKFGLRR